MIETPMNYTGSKFKLLEQLLPKFDYSKPYFIDLFTGGGSIYTNVLDRYEKIVANDIITDLINIHKGILESDDIINQTKIICPDKGEKVSFLNLRESYNNNPSANKLWALMLSSTNNMMRFNQKFKYNQTYGERGWNDNTTKKVELYKNHIRKYTDKIKFISKPFDEVNISSEKIMVYIDPPYGRVKENNGEIGKKQISEAGYNAFWKQEDDLNLYNYIKMIDEKGSSFMVSGVLEHNEKVCWMLDKLISDGFRYELLNYDYNKVSRKGNKNTKEIIIMNY